MILYYTPYLYFKHHAGMAALRGHFQSEIPSQSLTTSCQVQPKDPEVPVAPGPGISSYSAAQLALPRCGVPSASILMTGSRTCFPLKDARTRWRFYVWEMGQKAFFIAKNHASNLSFLEDPDEEQTSGFNAFRECPEHRKGRQQASKQSNSKPPLCIIPVYSKISLQV